MVCAPLFLPLFLPFVCCCCNFYCFCMLLAAASIYYIVSYFHQFSSKSAASISVICLCCICINVDPKSIYTSSVRQSRACPHILVAKSATFIFFSGLAAPSSVVDATFALLVPFGAVLLHIMINGRLFVVINTCPPACRLQAVISHSFILAGLTHLHVTVGFISPKQGSCSVSYTHLTLPTNSRV